MKTISTKHLDYYGANPESGVPAFIAAWRHWNEGGEKVTHHTYKGPTPASLVRLARLARHSEFEVELEMMDFEGGDYLFLSVRSG